MQTFDLIGEEAVLHLEGEVPNISAPYFAWDYRAQLRGHSLQVDLAIGDDDPAGFVDFFESIAQDWQGWPESRGYESLDGTLRIAATHDRVRSVRFEVRFRADSRSGFDWSATHRLTVEIGQLKGLAAVAREFGTGVS
jgi:hypothetical protein